MEVVEVMAKSILTPQKAGFLASRPHPFTHTLSPYTGCAYGATACGGYCYAQHEPNWLFGRDGADWGQLVKAKVNAAALLDEALRRMGAPRRRVLRIFMSSTTDPYQPGPETTYQLTRQCLGVFARYPDLDLLVIQTRSPLAKEDIGLMGRIPYAWLSVTLETDDWGMLRALGGGPPPAARLDLIAAAQRRGIPTQITVSPCLPYTGAFAGTLARSGARRIVVDTFVDGDGDGGKRTARSPIAGRLPDWRDTRAARALYLQLRAADVEVGWSAGGFCGIPPR